MWASQVAQMVKSLPAMRETRVRSLGSPGKIPWRRAWHPILVLLPGKFHGQRAWRAVVHGVSQGQTWLKRLSSSSIKYTNQGSSLITDGTFNKSFSINSLVAQRLKHLPAMRETWVRSLGREDPLEKEMATHSSIPAWRRIPWMQKLGGLQSTGLQRVGHDWATSLTHSLSINRKTFKFES